MRWTPPAADNGSPITAYVVTPYQDANFQQADRTFDGNTTNAVLSGSFAIGHSYTFTLTAVNARGSSVPSALSAAVISASPVAPAAPTAAPGNASAIVSWQPSPADNGTPVGYVLSAYRNGALTATMQYNSTALSQSFTGLTNGTNYQFTVAATNSAGTGPPSPLGPPVTVGTPTAPAITASPGSGQATINWTASAANGSAVTSYSLTPYLAGVAQTVHTFGPAARTATITGLTNTKTYIFKISARNARGPGPQSASVPITVGAPAAPTAPGAVPGNGSAKVHWTAPTVNNGAMVNGYAITPYLNGVAQPARVFTTAATTQTITGLTNATAYTFKIAARNTRGTGPPSIATAAITVGAPTAPTAVTATAGHLQAIVHWTAPNDNSSVITQYTVTPYIGTVAQAPRVYRATTTSRAVTGLTTGKKYTFKVSATNARGTGPQSAASGVVTIT